MFKEMKSVATKPRTHANVAPSKERKDLWFSHSELFKQIGNLLVSAAVSEVFHDASGEMI
jgi:hypothetical protein